MKNILKKTIVPLLIGFFMVFGATKAASVLLIQQGGTGQQTANSAFNALAPSQTGNSGKFLSTNGSNTSWVASNGMAIGNAVTSGTPGSILFVDGSGNLAQDNANLNFGISGSGTQMVVDNQVWMGTASGGTYGIWVGRQPFDTFQAYFENTTTVGNTYAVWANNQNNTLSNEFRFTKSKSGSFNFGAGQQIFKLTANTLSDFSAISSALTIPGTYSLIDFVWNTYDSTSTYAERMRLTSEGLLGIGTAAPAAAVHIVQTTEQLRVGYDASNYFKVTVGSTGLVNIDGAGANSEFVFNKNIGIGGNPIYPIDVMGVSPVINVQTTGVNDNTAIRQQPDGSGNAYFDNSGIGTQSRFRVSASSGLDTTVLYLEPSGGGSVGIHKSPDIQVALDIFANGNSGTGLQIDGTNYGGSKWAFGDGMAGAPANGVFSIRNNTTSNTPLIITGTGLITIPVLATGSTAPTTSGTTKMVIADANGLLSDTNIQIKVATVALTAQSANITATTLTSTAGLYRISYYIVDSVADLTAGAVSATFTYTDNGAAQTVNTGTVALATLGAFTQGTVVAQLASGNIQYSTTHTGIFGSAKYDIFITVERLN